MHCTVLKPSGSLAEHKQLCMYPTTTIVLVLQNELAILEFIHCLVETLDRYFSNVCELDLMFNLEMVSNYAHHYRFLGDVRKAQWVHTSTATSNSCDAAGPLHC